MTVVLRPLPPGIPLLPTAITLPETLEIRAMAEGKTVLEVGALLGYSTVVLAKVAERVVSVDPHEGYPEHDPKPTLTKYLGNLFGYEVRDKVTVCVGRDDEVLPYLRPNVFDAAFIDTTGRYEDTLRAMYLTVPLLKHHAVLAVHDCGHPEWPEAKEAIDRFARVWGTTYRVIDRLAIFEQTWG